MTAQEFAANVLVHVNRVADEIAELSIPRDDEPFTEWSTSALQRRVRENARLVLLDWLLPKQARQMPMMCPRCGVHQVDPVLLGTEAEGHICGQCWLEDPLQ